jgi:hypothetical protein
MCTCTHTSATSSAAASSASFNVRELKIFAAFIHCNVSSHETLNNKMELDVMVGLLEPVKMSIYYVSVYL